MLALIVLAVPAHGLAGAAGSDPLTATLAPAVTDFLGADGSAGRMDAIVTFHDDDGVTRLARLGTPLSRLESVPMAFVSLTAAQIREVASWAQTRSVWDNAQLELLLDEGTWMVKADAVWAGEDLAAGYDGTGVGVAVIDTGIDGLHPDLPHGTKVKRNLVFNVEETPGSGEVLSVDGPYTDTEHGHGTHVASIIAGTGAASDGRYRGVAPGADVYGLRVSYGNSMDLWWIARAFDWVLANGADHNIRVINNSWVGRGAGTTNPIRRSWPWSMPL